MEMILGKRKLMLGQFNYLTSVGLWQQLATLIWERSKGKIVIFSPIFMQSVA